MSIVNISLLIFQYVMRCRNHVNKYHKYLLENYTRTNVTDTRSIGISEQDGTGQSRFVSADADDPALVRSIGAPSDATGRVDEREGTQRDLRCCFSRARACTRGST